MIINFNGLTLVSQSSIDQVHFKYTIFRKMSNYLYTDRDLKNKNVLKIWTKEMKESQTFPMHVDCNHSSYVMWSALDALPFECCTMWANINHRIHLIRIRFIYWLIKYYELTMLIHFHSWNMLKILNNHYSVAHFHIHTSFTRRCIHAQNKSAATTVQYAWLTLRSL